VCACATRAPRQLIRRPRSLAGARAQGLGVAGGVNGIPGGSDALMDTAGKGARWSNLRLAAAHGPQAAITKPTTTPAMKATSTRLSTRRPDTTDASTTGEPQARQRPHRLGPSRRGVIGPTAPPPLLRSVLAAAQPPQHRGGVRGPCTPPYLRTSVHPSCY